MDGFIVRCAGTLRFLLRNVINSYQKHSVCIINNPSFSLNDPGVLDGCDGSDRTLYPVTENYTLPVAQATGRFAYFPS